MMGNFSSRSAFEAHSGGHSKAAPSALTEFVRKSTTQPEIKAYVHSMDLWRAEIPAIRDMSKPLPEETFKHLWLFTNLFSAALPTLASMCEGLSRRHNKVYKELADLLALGTKFNTYGIIRKQKHELSSNRYVPATTLITNILSYPTPADREDTRLPPQYIDEGSYLERALSDAMKDVFQIIFLQMREDKRKDQVDFLIERATHILAAETRFMPAARQGMGNAFEAVYQQMTGAEQSMIHQSRFTVGCQTSRDTIYGLIREVQKIGIKDSYMCGRGRDFV